MFDDQVIAPGVVYLDQDGKVKKMRENSIFPDLLSDIGHELLVDAQGEVIEASYIKYVPISELTPAQLSQLPIDFINQYYTDTTSQFAKTYKGITGTEEIFTLPSVSDSVKIEFENEFDRLCRQIINELEFGGLKLHEIAYQVALSEFLSRNEKYIIDPNTNEEILDEEWHSYLMVVWKNNYQDKVMTRGKLDDTYIRVVNLALRGAVLTNLLKQQVFTVSNDKVLEALVSIIRQPDIIHNLLSSGVFETFILDTFAQTFHQHNQYKISVYSSQVHTTNGIISEVNTELNVMSESLDSIYAQYRDTISEFPTPIFSYTFTEETIFSGHRLELGDVRDFRDLDTFGIKYFIVKDGSGYKRVGTFGTVKHDKRMDKIITDAISAAYIFIRTNIDHGAIQESELKMNLVSLIYESINYIPGDLISYERLYNKLVETWFKQQYDSSLSHSGIIKGSKQDIYESEIIDALNTQIWRKGTTLSKDDVTKELKKILKNPDFIQSYILNIYGHIESRLYRSIYKFISDLTNDITSSYGDIGLILSGNFEVRKGLIRGVEKNDYFITDYKITIEQLKNLGISKFFDSRGVKVQETDLKENRFINAQNELVKQFKILTSIDGTERALIEVNGEYTPVPSGYVSGINVGGRWIANALLTYIDGKVLLSEFFDPDFELDPDFMSVSSPRFLINDQYYLNYQNYIQDENIDIYTVFSFSEGSKNRNLGTIIHLTDPAFRTETDSLHYKLPRRSPFFKSSRQVQQKSKIVLDGIICNPFENRESNEIYGDEFTKDIFMKIFDSLFSPGVGLYKQRTQALAVKFLSYLNGISYGSNFEEFRQGPGVKDINAALKKLGFTKDELQSLIWKKIDSRTGKLVFSYDQTKKEWLKLLYKKITSYSPNDGSVYAQQRDVLLGLGSEYGKIDDNSIARNKKEFTIEEAKMGVEIFKAANVLFGQFTIRLMFANMIDYYGSAGSFGIKIVNRPPLRTNREISEDNQNMRDFLYKIGLIPSTFQYDRPIRDIITGKTATRKQISTPKSITTVTYLFGLFFLESHIYLEIENIANVKSPDNTLSFSLGPLVAITPFGGINGENLRDLSKNIGIYLETSYDVYRANNLDPTNVNLLGKNFLDDHSKIFDFISKKIKSTIIDAAYYRDKSKNVWLANQLIEHARLGLVVEKTASTTSGYLRDRLRNFYDNSKEESHQSSFILEFNYIMPLSKEPFKLRITLEELIKNEISAWWTHSLFGSSQYSAFEAQLLHQNSHNIRQYLKSIINIFGSQRVRIFPLLDTGNADTGYEHITDPKDYDWSILPEGENYFDIDLNKEKDIFKLQHIINLLYTGKFAFVVKKSTGTLNDGEMIFAFNRDGFLEPHEIFSQNMRIDDYSTKFKGDNDDWRESWIYPKAWSTTIHTLNNDIRSYISFIEDSNLDDNRINGFMRDYMQRMEILFPGYSSFIKEFLNL